MSPHVTRRDMAGVNRRPARGEQSNERSLRPLQVKRDLVIAADGHTVEVAVPGLPRINPQFLGASAADQVPGAFDVIGGERLAVMPLDALPQFEGQFLAVLA